jgi:hypothetical protein
MSVEPRCSEASRDVGEQLAGSAPYALAWVALEQSGPWGRRALTESHLDPGLGRAIEAAAAASDTRAVLIRRPGRHADEHGHEAVSDRPRHDAARLASAIDPRRLLVAFTHPRSPWLLEGSIRRPHDLLDLDWPALQSGDLHAVRASLPTLEPSDRPHLLVCTNGTRDVCCAVGGRPVALGVAGLRPQQVWEVTHTSGHRFAPTAALLPAGTLHGRLDASAAFDVLTAAEDGRTVVSGSRGRSTWPAAAQVAELAVREEISESGLHAVWVGSHEQVDEHRWRTRVEHDDGRQWQVETRSEETDERRPESCGKPLGALRRYRTSLIPVPAAL